MNNLEKFIEVFGFEPDTTACIPKCPEMVRETACPYVKELNNRSIVTNYYCNCESWWFEEFKENKKDNK